MDVDCSEQGDGPLEEQGDGRRKRRRRLFAAVTVCGSLVLTVIAVECGLAIAAASPLGASTWMAHPLGRYAARYELTLPQYAFGQHDPGLGYVLKPGEWSQEEREFDIRIKVNSLGVRDSEAAMTQPEVICIGDSFTMGWGIDKEQRFSELLQEQLGMRTLNCGISSYGTVRELSILSRVDLSKTKLIILQHCQNDIYENLSFLENDRLQVMDKGKWQQTYATHKKQTGYSLGKYTIHLLPALARHCYHTASGAKPVVPLLGYKDARSRGEIFAAVVGRFETELRDIPILVFDMNEYYYQNSTFITDAARASRSQSSLKLQYVDVSPYLDESHFFRIDGHLNAAGNAKVAELLAQVIPQMGIRKSDDAPGD
jgi:lysophospholipase L1-like esterase